MFLLNKYGFYENIDLRVIILVLNKYIIYNKIIAHAQSKKTK